MLNETKVDMDKQTWYEKNGIVPFEYPELAKEILRICGDDSLAQEEKTILIRKAESPYGIRPATQEEIIDAHIETWGYYLNPKTQERITI